MKLVKVNTKISVISNIVLAPFFPSQLDHYLVEMHVLLLHNWKIAMKKMFRNSLRILI